MDSQCGIFYQWFLRAYTIGSLGDEHVDGTISTKRCDIYNKSFFKTQLLTKILTLGQSPECHDTETISLKVVTLLVHSQ